MSNKDISIFYDSPLGIMLVDIEGNILEANTKILELFEYSNIIEFKEQINLLSIDSIISEHYKRCFDSKIAFDFKSNYITINGKELFLRFILIPIYNNKKEINGCITIIEDILSHKNLKEKLSLIKDEWENTFNALPDLIAILDNNYKIINVNKAMADKVGKSPQECIGLSCYELVHGTLVPPETCPLSKLLVDGQTHHIESREELLNGDYSVVVSPIKDINNNIVGSVHIARDITEKKQIRLNLQQSESKFRSVFEYSPIPIAITKVSDGYFLNINQSWERLFGYSKNQVIGKCISDINIYQNIQDRDMLLDIFKENKQIINFKLTLLHKSGTLIYGLFSAAPVEVNGESYWVTSFIDTTEQTLLEQSIRDFKDTVAKNARREISELLRKGTYIR